MMVRYGIIGYGRWGRNLVRASLQAGGVPVWVADVAEVTDPPPGARAILGEPSAGDLAEVDAVLVASPTDTHHRMAMLALSAGRHVFVEKPVGTSTDQVVDAVSAARSGRLVLAAGHEFVYHRGFQEILMPLRFTGGMVDLTWLNDRPLDPRYLSLVRDLGPHPASLLTWVRPFGWDVRSVTASRDLVEAGLVSSGDGPTIRARIRVGASPRYRKTRLAVVTTELGTRVLDDASAQVTLPDETLIRELSAFFSACSGERADGLLTAGTHVIAVEEILSAMEGE